MRRAMGRSKSSKTDKKSYAGQICDGYCLVYDQDLAALYRPYFITKTVVCLFVCLFMPFFLP